ncbi:MAG: mechanosensitive ion channel family protein [Pseudomonadota bacterium]
MKTILLWCQWAVFAVWLLIFAPFAEAQTADSASAEPQISWTVLTNTPRDTLEAFVRLRTTLEVSLQAYVEDKSLENFQALQLAGRQMASLIDLPETASVTGRSTGGETITAMLDIFARVGEPDLEAAPGREELKASGATVYTVPKTPFRIVQISEGERSGEWLFEARTVDAAQSFYKSVRNRPADPTLDVPDWRLVLNHITGPMIPDALVSSIPNALKQPIWGTPIWKAIAAGVLSFLVLGLLSLWLRILPRPEEDVTGSGTLFIRVLGPFGVGLIIWAFYEFMRAQLNLTGGIVLLMSVILACLFWVAMAWAFWLFVIATTERIMEKTSLTEGTIDGNMFQLCSRVLAVVGVVIILAYGAQTIGVPVLSLLAGLGIGGVAIALAARPTLENLIGGIILFLDKPIRVMEYCEFGDKAGTVVKIGARSVQIIALDRTTITIPNSRFADMEIINWSRCDRLFIKQTIGLRYETTNDQLLYILAKIREMYHAHPLLDGNYSRAILTGYFDAALNIMITVYVNTQDWNEYYAARQDVYLRIKTIIEEAGTYYAVPMQVQYSQEGSSLNPERSQQASDEVEKWRKNNAFPFPKFREDTIEEITNAIEYPVVGSPDHKDYTPDGPVEDKDK